MLITKASRWATQVRLTLLWLAATVAMAAGTTSAAPILTISGTCDTLANSTFTIKNIGTAMPVANTWELYQNSIFLTSGPFTLTESGTAGDTLQLTINGLYGTIEVRVKDQNNALVVNATAVCVQRPLVTINQATTQTDPTSVQPILFTAVFSRAVTGFSNTDVLVTGLAGAPTIVVTDSGDHMTYTVAVSGVANLETVRVTIPQDAATDTAGLGNLASTSTDNRVTYRAPPNLTLSGTCDTHANSDFTIKNLGGAMFVDYRWEIYQNSVFLTNGSFRLTLAGTAGDTQQLTINGLYGNVMVKVKNEAGVEILSSSAFCPVPTATINQAAAQPDPTNASPILFDAVFSVPVTGFTNTDVQISGMAAVPGITVTDSGDHMHFTVAVTGATSGETIRATIPANSVRDAANSAFLGASTSTDNSVTFDTSRRVNSLAVDAANAQVVTAALYGSGLWRTTNSGGSWAPVVPQPGNTWVNALLIDPTLATRYFVATFGAGVFRSTNSGSTWSACSTTGLGSPRVRTLAISSSGMLVAATEAGVYKSTDCGNWSSANQGLPAASTSPVTALLVDPAVATTFYAGVDGVGIFKSTNGGTVWSAATTQPGNLRVTALAIKPTGGSTLHAATLGGVQVSSDGGLNWTACATQPSNPVVLSLVTDATGVLYAGTEAGVAVSGDGCATWLPIAPADLVGTGPQSTGQGNTKFSALAIAGDARRTLYSGNRSGTVLRADVLPLLLSATVSGTTNTTTTLTLTSSETSKGLWIVVPRNATAPTFTQVRNGGSYPGATVIASGSNAITQNTPTNFLVTGLAPATDYDLYTAIEDLILVNGFPPVKRQFTTLPNTYAITVSVSPAGAGTASCTPNPVNEGSSSTCTAVVNPVYAPGNWSGDCSGPTCVLTNVIAARSVTANFVPTLNVDGSDADSRYQSVTDGQIIVRYMQGLRGAALVAGAGVTGAMVTDPAVMATYLDLLGAKLDIDGNGAIDAATDGLLIARYMLGFRSDALITNALGKSPRVRSTAAEIEAWLAALMP